MELTQLYTWACLLLTIIASKISQSCAKPTYYDLDNYESYDRYDRSYSNSDSGNDNAYALTYGKPLTQDRLKKLNPGYYYVDDGYIAPVASDSAATNTRRQDPLTLDDGAALPSNVRFTPLVRYKQTRTKRKKLFVPNFFG